MKKLIVTILFISMFSSGCANKGVSVSQNTDDFELQQTNQEKVIENIAPQTDEQTNDTEELHPIEIEERECMKKADYTTAGMTMCTYNAMDRWFDEIDKYLKLLKKVTTEEEYANILKAQENWKKYQESEFVAISILMKKDGTIYQNILAGEECGIVKQRAMDLKGLYEELSSD